MHDADALSLFDVSIPLGSSNRSQPNRQRNGESSRRLPKVCSAVQPPLFWSPSSLVLEFHEAFGLARNSQPTLAVPHSLKALRQALLEEEVHELQKAASADDLIEIADALADIVYVAYGTALTYGIDLDVMLTEVHRSNMTKLGSDGKPVVRSDGKVTKGPNYSPPNLRQFLRVPEQS